MSIQPLEISEFLTETSIEPTSLICEINEKKEHDMQEEIDIEEKVEKKFITSPADIDVHRKVELQDADISEEHKQAFRDLCTEFIDIFSTDSGDIRKTPLLEVEIDTGDSPPITQKPLYPSFETHRMGTKRVGDLGKSRCDSKKCFSLG